MKNSLQQKLHTKMFKIITMKNIYTMQTQTEICYMH